MADGTPLWGVGYTDKLGVENLIQWFFSHADAVADLQRRHQQAAADPHHVGANLHLVTLTVQKYEEARHG